MISLLAPFAAYLPAEALGVSGVLAAVVAGLIAGRRAARALSPTARLMGRGVWDIVIFTINGFAFMLIGLQLPSILDSLAAYSPLTLAGWGLAISLTVIVARIVWVFPATYLPRRLSARIRASDPYPSPRAVFVVSWAGMRGAVSLAAALALPLEPKPFPERDLVIFLTFCVIVATLVGQGLSLPWVVRRLGVVATDGPDTEEAHARLAAVEAALTRLDDLEVEYPGPQGAGRPAALALRARGRSRLAASGGTARRRGAGAARPPRDPQRGPGRRARRDHRAARRRDHRRRGAHPDRARPRPRGAPLGGLTSGRDGSCGGPGSPC